MAEQMLIPRMGFGTYGRTGEDGIAAILLALETGYRHLDTAQSYDTERECGLGLARSGLKRHEVFLTTKITGDNCAAGKLIPSLRASLDRLGVDQVDLTLIHWPVSPHGELPKQVYLAQLAEAHALGLTRLIGVSNFTIADLEASAAILGDVKIANNQFERHPYLQNNRLVDYCVANGIPVTCYLPLARGACLDDPVMTPMAERRGVSVHQIALAFSLTQGHIVIPTSGRHDRIVSNFSALDIALTGEEIAAIGALDRGARQVNPSWSPAWD